MRLAEGNGEFQWVEAIARALVEAAWLRGDNDSAREQVAATLAIAPVALDPRLLAPLWSWMRRLGGRPKAPAGAPAAVTFEVQGRWAEAAAGVARAWPAVRRGLRAGRGRHGRGAHRGVRHL